MIDIDSLSDKTSGFSRGIGSVLKSLFGSRNERVVQALFPLVRQVKEREPWAQSLSQEQMKAKTAEWKAKLKNNEIQLDSILPEAFALARESAKRSIGLRPFDVQVLGGIVLHQGKISEMSTGEGKTLVATMPAYLNALTGKGVFIVTVNDYLARRDRDWMAPVFEYLGLSVGAIQSSMSAAERIPHYACDITYGTNNEYGFDYLRDNMKVRVEDQVQRFLHYAIIDEVDSILIDEARTPLIISGPAEESTERYMHADRIARELQPGKHFEIKEKEKVAPLTDEGIETAERLAGVDTFYSGKNMDWPHLIETSLRAHHLYRIDREYVVQNGEIIIVDDFTGRLMHGRRWSDGLHQAVEAKEGIRPREENQTLATITFQNYFRLFEKLAGMTGTAMTEAGEFAKIYNLDVVNIPPNRSNVRIDHNDVVYRTEVEKFRSIVEEIVQLRQNGRPILVGTVSIEKSEKLSQWLSEPVHIRTWLAKQCDWALEELTKKGSSLDSGLQEELKKTLSRPAAMDPQSFRNLFERVHAAAPKLDLTEMLERMLNTADAAAAVEAGIPHNVLNAKYHEREAQIIAQAGRLNALTIATNMAGRGTDILLGGNSEALLGEKIAQEEAAPDDPRIEAWRLECKQQCAKEHDQVVAAGGLYVLGTERHEARRIDNQLRGRCARQGDPGASKFFLSLQDDLMRIFYSEGVTRLMERLGMTEGQDITSGLVSRAIERAQKKVESRNFEARRNLLEYDEVMDKQRKFIYEERQEVLEGMNLREKVLGMIEDNLPQGIESNREEGNGAVNVEGVRQWVKHKFGLDIPATVALPSKPELLEKTLLERIRAYYDEREKIETPENLRKIERFLLLNAIDTKWKDHLYAMDALRDGIGLRGYAQIDPKNEYKREGFANFERLLSSISEEVTNYVLKIHIAKEDEQRLGSTFRQQEATHAQAESVVGSGPGQAPAEAARSNRSPGGRVQAPAGRAFDLYKRTQNQQQRAASQNLSNESQAPVKSNKPEVGRNDPCPCGSGKKYKKCHGQSS